MNWCITSGGRHCSGTDSATDGDEDIIFALLMASDQWSGTNYLTPAQQMIGAMRKNSLLPRRHATERRQLQHREFSEPRLLLAGLLPRVRQGDR